MQSWSDFLNPLIFLCITREGTHMAHTYKTHTHSSTSFPNLTHIPRVTNLLVKTIISRVTQKGSLSCLGQWQLCSQKIQNLTGYLTSQNELTTFRFQTFSFYLHRIYIYEDSHIHSYLLYILNIYII